jgi:predicted pyridoxine 5'-phosphate oxidase superfamily flavin-nucleotide-binding protein
MRKAAWTFVRKAIGRDSCTYDESTIAIRDRAGNRRGDTFTNVISRSDVALLFMIPGHGETLRLSGRAEIVSDA